VAGKTKDYDWQDAMEVPGKEVVGERRRASAGGPAARNR
jgi:hypothetical protein